MNDYLAIQQLVQLYAFAVDSRDPDLFDEIFAPDAVLDIKLFGLYDREGWRENARRGVGSFDATMHFCSPPVVRFEGDRAHSRCYFLAQHARNALRPEPFLLIGGIYDDECRRIDGRWWITRRTGTPSWWQGNPSVLGSDVLPGGIEWMETRALPAWLRRA